ncbi:Hypothetical Protein FCC1311_044162 [Hondaea fermentalgiana]|uniref:Uncharacterized protein n=1 Tax=Hondaea fermentalgiana TaxID=2315210 RepID=A0A2R5GHR9_9STRA|nr:Hypothetical Protein FCC1311_044162 [Hondaea fermentalgiana]|eukprot:GBG28193.1 Hypothetical Protein FCC1311_044162 [Hondaea fermentalgiana]
MKAAFGLIAMAVLATKSAMADDNCETVCRGTCNTWQDPHVIDFSGDSFKIESSVTDVTLYEVDNFAVWAPQTHRSVDGTDFQLFYSLSFGGENITADALCSAPGDSTTRVKLFDENKPGSDYLEAYIWCMQADSYPQLGLFLAVQLTKVDSQSNGETFAQIEAGLGAIGECIAKNDEPEDDDSRRLGASRSLRGLKSAGTFSPAGPAWIEADCYTVCSSEEPCQGTGDPHIETFFGDKYNVQPSGPENFTVYEINGTTTYDHDHDVNAFDVWVETKNSGRTYVVHFGDEILDASSCTKSGQSFAASHTFANGDNLYLQAECTYASNHKSEYGLFFNWYVHKFDVSYGETSFKTLEEDEGSDGLCISKPIA